MKKFKRNKKAELTEFEKTTLLYMKLTLIVNTLSLVISIILLLLE